MESLDFNRQKKEAEERMFKMHNRAMPPVPPFVRTPGRETNNQNDETPKEEQIREVPPKKKGLLGGDILKFLDLKNLNLDSDRMLILLMIVLLSGESSDEILLFALAYIML